MIIVGRTQVRPPASSPISMVFVNTKFSSHFFVFTRADIGTTSLAFDIFAAPFVADVTFLLNSHQQSYLVEVALLLDQINKGAR